MRICLDPDVIRAGLITSGSPWREVEFHAALGSTNERARELLRHDPRPWLVVLTDHQTGGRGRQGRSWVVPAGASVAVSAVVPLADPAAAGWVPLLAGLALAEAVREVTAAAGTPLAPRLKWPNDVLLPEDGHRKASGILCELVRLHGGHGVVVGTGVNVDQGRDELPVDTATSLRLAGAQVRREDLVAAYLDRLAALVGPRGEGPGRDAAARARYRAACSTVGREVLVHLPTGATARGRATGLDPTGALLVRTDDGEHAYAAGDVVHVRPATGTWDHA